MDVYVRLANAPVASCRELIDDLSGAVVLDYAADGRLVGIEVIGAAGVDVDGLPVEPRPSAD
jgi:hypothetical protein